MAALSERRHGPFSPHFLGRILPHLRGVDDRERSPDKPCERLLKATWVQPGRPRGRRVTTSREEPGGGAMPTSPSRLRPSLRRTSPDCSRDLSRQVIGTSMSPGPSLCHVLSRAHDTPVSRRGYRPGAFAGRDARKSRPGGGFPCPGNSTAPRGDPQDCDTEALRRPRRDRGISPRTPAPRRGGIDGSRLSRLMRLPGGAVDEVRGRRTPTVT